MTDQWGNTGRTDGNRVHNRLWEAYRDLAASQRKVDALEVKANTWRILAYVLGAGYVVILLNTYIFGG